jgi:predicted metal-dependent peptidase
VLKKPTHTLQFESFQWLSSWKTAQRLLESEASSQNYPELDEVKEDVERAIALLIGRFPFFGTFIYRFRILYVHPQDPHIQTMATDGKNIFINPAFAKSLTDDQTIFVLCHEILHNVMMHFSRAKAIGVKNMGGQWNVAADYEINPMLVEEGLLTADELVNGIKGLYKKEYIGMTAEEIYELIKNQKMPDLPPSLKKKMQDAAKELGEGAPQPPGGGGGGGGEGDGEGSGGSGSGSGDKRGGSAAGAGGPGAGGPGGEEDGAGKEGTGEETQQAKENGIGGMIDSELSAEKQKELGVPLEIPSDKEGEKLMEEAVRNKKQLKGGKNAGTGKGLLERAIDSFSKPQVNWKNELSRIIGKMVGGSEEYFGKRRHIHKGDYFYGDRDIEKSLKKAVMPVDVSGSIGDEELKTMLSEIVEIIRVKKLRKTDVVYFDDGISGVDTVGKPPHFDWSKSKGGGGTNFAQPMEYLHKQWKAKKMELAVFITDGFASMNNFDQDPPFKKRFIWLIIDNPGFTAPFGKVIHITTKKK